MLKVIANITAKPGHAQALKQVLLDLAAASRQETDCTEYELFQREDDENQFATVELWSRPEALAAHMKTAHVGAAVKAATPLLAKPFDIVRYRECV